MGLPCNTSAIEYRNSDGLKTLSNSKPKQKQQDGGPHCALKQQSTQKSNVTNLSRAKGGKNKWKLLGFFWTNKDILCV